MGITGFQFNIQPICQMLAGYMFKGRPLANMVRIPSPTPNPCSRILSTVLVLFNTLLEGTNVF